MFFGNLIIRFFNISWLSCEQKQKQEQKRNSVVFKGLR